MPTVYVRRLRYYQSMFDIEPEPHEPQPANMIPMPTQTSERCWRCLASFSTQPMALVTYKLDYQSTSLQDDTYWLVMGNFCSLSCCRGFCDSQERFRTRPARAYAWMLEFAYCIGLLHPLPPTISPTQIPTELERLYPVVHGAPPPQGMLACLDGVIVSHQDFAALFCNDRHPEHNCVALALSHNTYSLDEEHINTTSAFLWHTEPSFFSSPPAAALPADHRSVGAVFRMRQWHSDDWTHAFHPCDATPPSAETTHPLRYCPGIHDTIFYRLLSCCAAYRPNQSFTCHHCFRAISCGTPLPAPIAPSATGYEVMGRFCSPECAYGFLYASDEYREMCAPLCFEFFFVLGYTDGGPFAPAPQPFDVQLDFGGRLTRDEFAQRFCSLGNSSDLDNGEEQNVYVMPWGTPFAFPNPTDAHVFSEYITTTTAHQ